MPAVLATPPPVSHRTAEENLGIGYLAAMLRRQGVEVRIIDGWLEGDSPASLADKISKCQPLSWVGFSSYLSNASSTAETIAALRAKDITSPVIAGGYGPTFAPEDYLANGVDVCVIGEGEDTLSKLDHYYGTGQGSLKDIPGICFRNAIGDIVRTAPAELMVNIDNIGEPARDTLPLLLKKKSPPHIDSSRGCVAHCTFCSIVPFFKLSHGPAWRQKSITAFVDNIERLTEQGASVIKVVDDSFIEPPRDAAWCAEFADEIERRGIQVRLRGQIRADRATYDVLKHLRRAGFYSFACGIESFSPAALKRMAKSATIEDNFCALNAFRENGFIVQAGHILFDPYTTLSELYENYEGMRATEWVVNKGLFSEAFAAVGTPFTRVLLKRGDGLSSSASLGNVQYEIKDVKARMAYQAIKLWHRSHMKVYDMVIDPIIAPKAIEDDHMSGFVTLTQEMRKIDNAFFGRLLKEIDKDAATAAINEFTLNEIAIATSQFNVIQSTAVKIYRNASLNYDAAPNPFVC